MKKSLMSALLAFALTPCFPAEVFADNTEKTASEDDSRIEIVVVTGVRMRQDMTLETSQVVQPGLDNLDCGAGCAAGQGID